MVPDTPEAPANLASNQRNTKKMKSAAAVLPIHIILQALLLLACAQLLTTSPTGIISDTCTSQTIHLCEICTQVPASDGTTYEFYTVDCADNSTTAICSECMQDTLSACNECQVQHVDALVQAGCHKLECQQDIMMFCPVCSDKSVVNLCRRRCRGSKANSLDCSECQDGLFRCQSCVDSIKDLIYVFCPELEFNTSSNVPTVTMSF